MIKKHRGHTQPSRSSAEARKVLSKFNYEQNTLEDVKHVLSYLMEERPAEAYAIALDLLRAPHPSVIAEDLGNIARTAARNSLLNPPLNNCIAERDYIRLAAYRFRCSIALLQSLATGETIKSMGTDWTWYDARCGVCPLVPESVVAEVAILGSAKPPTAWWATYWETVFVSFGQFPSEKSPEIKYIRNSTLQALKKACPTCHEAAEKEFPTFEEKLISAVAKIIDRVHIPIAD